MARLTQCEMILRHLKEIGPITPKEAMDLYGVMRLAARIHDLRQQGHPIGDELVATTNRYGDTVQVARYRLAGQLDLELS